MVRSVIIITILALLPALPPCLAGPPLEDLQRMEGSWSVKYAEKGNKPVPSEEARAMNLRITGPVFSIIVDGKVVNTATLTLDPAKEPKQFKMDSPDGKQSVLGIYKIEPEEIRLCWDNKPGKRPVTFSGINESGSLVYFRLVKTKL
jgi:uncharacterized protein (TIGR03067 family)